MKKSSVVVIIIFFILGFLNIAFFYSGIMVGRCLTLPFLMPLLGFLYLTESNEKQKSRVVLVLLALTFSLIGDLLLLFLSDLLIFGLVSFLMTHLLYIIIFFKGRMKELMTFPKILGSLLVILYGEIFYFVLFFSRHLTDDLKIPVLIYSVVFTTGIIAAISRYKKVRPASFRMVLCGAVLFLISDSIIALNRFVLQFHLAFLFILSLYFTGQFLIIKGLINEHK